MKVYLTLFTHYLCVFFCAEFSGFLSNTMSNFYFAGCSVCANVFSLIFHYHFIFRCVCESVVVCVGVGPTVGVLKCGFV